MEKEETKLVSFRWEAYLVDALDGAVSKLRKETLGDVTDRSKAVRFLVKEGLIRRGIITVSTEEIDG